MNIKNFLSTKEKDDQSEYYWSLIIEPNWVQAGIWKVDSGEARVVTVSKPNAWDLDDELVTAADTSLSAAIQSIPEDINDPEKTVFGVFSSWVDKGQIKSEYLHIIKKLCSELSLKPAGFVVLSEAITHYLKSLEGAPVTAVMIGVMEEELEITVSKLGNISGTVQVSRSMSLAEDIVEGLTRLKIEDTLPSRFILFNSKEAELEDVRQKLLEVHWDEFDNLKFLHTPQIEIITPEKKVHAVSLAGAVDIAHIAELSGEEKNDEEAKNDFSEEESNVESVSAEELGFVINGDIHTQTKEEIKKPLNDMPTENTVSSPEIAPKINDVSEISESKSKKMKFGRPSFSLPSFTFLKRFRFGGGSSLQKILVIGLVVFLVLAGAGFYAWWYLPKAEVTVYLAAQKLDQRMDITLDPDITEPNYSDAILPAQVYTVTVSGEMDKGTSGTKTVGERAQGEVTLYRVGSQIELDRGSILSGPSGYAFTLDDKVTVASGSASGPGTASVNVTANAIGADYNLAGGTTFEIDGYSLSDLEAKSTESFSGGSSTEISAVSEEDRKTLLNSLEDELKEKAIAEANRQMQSDSGCVGCTLVEGSYTILDSNPDFSGEVGSEADTISLSLELEVQILAVSEETLNEFARTVLADRIPDEYVLRDDQIDSEFEFEEEVDGKYELSAMIAANLLPTVSSENITEKIRGKYPQVAKQFLVDDIPGFVRAEITLIPSLPGRLGTLPHVSDNIEVLIAADK